MNQRYFDYALYNIWANNKIINKLLEQDDKLLSHELVGSYPTIRATILGYSSNIVDTSQLPES